MIGIEINLRAVFGPGDVGIVIASAGQLLRRHFVVATARRVDNPDVLRVFRVQLVGAIGAIDRARDHADVALVLFCRSRSRTCCRRR